MCLKTPLTPHFLFKWAKSVFSIFRARKFAKPPPPSKNYCGNPWKYGYFFYPKTTIYRFWQFIPTNNRFLWVFLRFKQVLTQYDVIWHHNWRHLTSFYVKITGKTINYPYFVYSSNLDMKRHQMTPIMRSYDVVLCQNLLELEKYPRKSFI